MLSPRNSWQVTRAVWYALFMREALAKTTQDRFAWFWMLVEPIAMIAVMIGIRTVLMGGEHISGASLIAWMLLGLLGFYLFRDGLQRSLGAIQAYKGLFAYRQVKSIDPVLVRCFLDGVIQSFIFIAFVLIAALVGMDFIAVEPLYALFSWLSLWGLGLGAALTFSAMSELIPEVGKVIRITTLPLLIISGVILPLNFLPFWLQELLLLNPVVHGLEFLRMSFFENYHHLKGVSWGYLWFWNLSLISLGLMLHIRFEARLKAQ